MRKQITIKDIARESGVSTQTVSRVVNNHPDVSHKTFEKVQKAISKLGYSPNAVARRLVLKRSCIIGVAASVYEFQGGSGIAVVGVEQQANLLGYSLILQLLHHPETPEVEEILNNFVSEKVDGIIWAVPEIGNNRSWFKENQSKLNMPIVFLNMQPHPGLNVVSIDNRQGGRIATDHLLQNGYRNIGFIAGPEDWWEVRERQLGWQDALSSYGILPEERQIARGGSWMPDGGERGMQMLLDQYPEVEAVFTCNDYIALGTLKVAYQRGLRVPQDFAIVGFDNRLEAAYYLPSLTTVHHQITEVGSLAMRELGRMIEAEQLGKSISPPGAILLQPSLVVRESSLPTKNIKVARVVVSDR
jgi:LacI family transcriptional regulator